MSLITYLIRTHVAPKAALALLAIEVFNLFNRGMPWRGELVWTVDWVGTALVLIGPVLAGAAAIDAGRLSRAGSEYLMPGGGLVSRAYVITWLAATVPAIAVHLVTVTVILLVSNSASQISPWPSAVAVLAQVCGIAFYAALGAVCGRLAGSIAGPPIAVLAGVVLFWQFGTSPGQFSFLMFGRATSSVLGLQYNTNYFLVQTLCLAVLILALMTLPVRVIGGVRRPPHTVTAVSIVAIVAALVLFPSTKAERFVPVTVAPTSCTGENPRVCVYPDHERFLDDAHRAAAQLRAAGAALGVEDLLPTELRERTPGAGPAPDARGRFQIPVESFSFHSPGLTMNDLATQMILPFHCPLLYGDRPPSMEFAEDLNRASYTLLKAGGATDDPMMPSESDMSKDELRETIESFRNCRFR